MKTHREFYLSFAKDPQLFINKWLISQSRGIDSIITYILKLYIRVLYLVQIAYCKHYYLNVFLLSTDLKTMTDVAGNPEEERHTDFYYQPWAQEAVCRYFYSKIQQKRQELDSALGVRNG